jgi:hypothetical protein
MNVDSSIVNFDTNDFVTSTLPLRVIASASIVCANAANWQVVARVDDGADGIGADCWLLAAGDLAGIAIEAVVRAGLPLVLVVTTQAILPSAWLDLADGFVLPGDDDAAIAAVLTRIVAPAPGYGVADFSDGTAQTINALSAEAGRIAEQLARLVSEQRSAPDPVSIDARLVRRMIKLRRDRDRYFPADIFADPAWDMLLDLTAARLEGKRVPVSSLCIAAAVPTTTALRWIRSLTEAGLLDRYTDPSDARRSHIEIAEPAAASMLAYLRAFSAAFAVR